MTQIKLYLEIAKAFTHFRFSLTNHFSKLFKHFPESTLSLKHGFVIFFEVAIAHKRDVSEILFDAGGANIFFWGSGGANIIWCGANMGQRNLI